MSAIKQNANEKVIVGFDTKDDAGVFEIGDGLVLVQTVDFITPVVDDPYEYGQIAAANALSDSYAMNIRPLTALNIACFNFKEFLHYKKIDISSDVSERRFQMTEIEFVGYSAVHPSDFIYDVPNGFTGYLLLLFDSPSELLIDGRLMRTAANSAILYTPGSRIYYRAAGEEYRNDWIRFRSDHSFVKLFPLTNTPFPVTDPEYCHQLFKLLTWESAFFSSESEANITHLLRVLFSKLREGIQNESPGIHDHELVALHKMIYNNPQLPWNINMMAAKLHLSPSHLQTLYHRQFGSSCMDNVIEGRLRRAQDLLEYSEYSIRDISEQCGYNNVEHFCRQFRQHNGCTPGQYRKNASAGSNKRLLTHNTLGGREFEKINRNHPVAESFP